jgi:hypothetical protein
MAFGVRVETVIAPESRVGTDRVPAVFALGVVFHECSRANSRWTASNRRTKWKWTFGSTRLHALEEPARRYQQASQVRTAVETIARRSAPPPTAQITDRFWKRMAVAMALRGRLLAVTNGLVARRSGRDFTARPEFIKLCMPESHRRRLTCAVFFKLNLALFHVPLELSYAYAKVLCGFIFVQRPVFSGDWSSAPDGQQAVLGQQWKQ